MRKIALLVAVAVVASAPSVAFAAKKKAAKAPETWETLNRDSIKMWHDVFIWPSEAPAKKGKKK